ncbi:MAG TPA: metalloregulator ArsR/SmtB family transcription factor [Thermodesulfobacteriota bacterium]|nr:metalloregulator ArsR/SmtB family transcription factor [Thermodesulfobacteriota bacterium]
MVEYKNANLDNVLHALSNSTRRNIVLQLAKEDLTVNELAEKYEMSLQAVSKHIQVLVKSGLVVKRKSGRERLCRVSYGPLESVSDMLDEFRRFWEARMDSLEKYFENRKTGGDAGE